MDKPSLARLAERELFTGEDDLVLAGDAGSYLDGSALRRRYKQALEKAGLRPLRFHDLRHTFGTRRIAKADGADRGRLGAAPEACQVHS